MSRVNNINIGEKTTSQNKSIITPKTTGYAAGVALAVATTRAFTKAKSIRKTHKFWGYLAAALTLLHIGNVEYLHFKYKNKSQKNG